MNLTKQEQLVLIFILGTLLLSGAVFLVRHFRSDWRMGTPSFVAEESDQKSLTEKQPVNASAGQNNGSQLAEAGPVSVGTPATTNEIIVHVAGEVHKPDVYHLPRSARVQDGILAAGGATEQADINRLNLAARLMDGQKIYVPTKPEALPLVAPSVSSSAGASPSHSRGQPQQNSPPPSGASVPAHQAETEPGLANNLPSPQPSNKISLNTATAAELEKLPRIGPVIAQRIIEYRETRGGFQTIEELKQVKGIGEKTFEKLKDLVSVW